MNWNWNSIQEEQYSHKSFGIWKKKEDETMIFWTQTRYSQRTLSCTLRALAHSPRPVEMTKSATRYMTPILSFSFVLFLLLFSHETKISGSTQFVLINRRACLRVAVCSRPSNVSLLLSLSVSFRLSPLACDPSSYTLSLSLFATCRLSHPTAHGSHRGSGAQS